MGFIVKDATHYTPLCAQGFPSRMLHSPHTSSVCYEHLVHWSAFPIRVRLKAALTRLISSLIAPSHCQPIPNLYLWPRSNTDPSTLPNLISKCRRHQHECQLIHMTIIAQRALLPVKNTLFALLTEVRYLSPASAFCSIQNYVRAHICTEYC